jgi:hypothetical protein
MYHWRSNRPARGKSIGQVGDRVRIGPRWGVGVCNGEEGRFPAGRYGPEDGRCADRTAGLGLVHFRAGGTPSGSGG